MIGGRSDRRMPSVADISARLVGLSADALVNMSLDTRPGMSVSVSDRDIGGDQRSRNEKGRRTSKERDDKKFIRNAH